MKTNNTPDPVVRDNRKYRPKFLVLLMIGIAAGAVLGYGSAWLVDARSLPEKLDAAGKLAGAIAPFSVLLAVPFWLGALCCYLRARALFRRWDGEDESTPEQAESLLTWAMAWLSVSQVVSYTMFGISASLLPLGYLTTDWGLLAAVLQMLVMVFAGIVLQGFVVDLVRRLNPGKQGNVYDVKFRKKWLSSCDEAERQQIGQAAYVSFTVSNYTGLLVWVAMLVINTLIPIGPLPILAVMIPWAAGQFAYMAECIRMNRKSPR